MRSLRTHSRISLQLLSFTLITLIAACSEEQKSEKIVVKVNESVLTKTMLDSALAAKANSAKLKDEFINDWIETEVLYQEAVKDGVLDEDDFVTLLNRSKKELAGIFYIKKLLSENEQTPDEDEIAKYFNDYKDDFRLKDDLYKLNFLRVKAFDKAVQVRSKIIESSWDKAKDFFRTDSTLSFSSENLYRNELQSAILLRIVNSLMVNETSIVLEIEPGMFSVVQLAAKYPVDSIAPYEIEKENAKNRLIVLKQKEFVKEHIKKLVEEHNLEIERYTE
ncbi:MAG: hypothetical protein HYZ10_03115 [Ignavibacteriales bacterium]|nr:hypothetical protein [Ignavibacteriales bacterium]